MNECNIENLAFIDIYMKLSLYWFKLKYLFSVGKSLKYYTITSITCTEGIYYI